MKLKISQIKTDGGTQPRAELNQQVIEEYAEAIGEGAIFPPVDVFYDGTDYWLGDGFHRIGGHKLAGKGEVEATIHQGTRGDALDYACSAAPNSKHGLRETPEDRHRRVRTMIQKHPDWTNVQIAKHCGVSREMVRRVSIMHNVQDRPTTRTVERGNTTYTMNTAPIGKTPPTGQPAEESIYEEEVIDIDIAIDTEEEIAIGDRQEDNTGMPDCNTPEEAEEVDTKDHNIVLNARLESMIVDEIVNTFMRRLNSTKSKRKKIEKIKAVIKKLSAIIEQLENGE
jgi:hypothetical protein